MEIRLKSFVILIGIIISIIGCQPNSTINDNQPISSDTIAAEAPKEFIDLLFAEQTLLEINNMAKANVNENDTTTIWSKFIIASNHTSENNKKEAIRVLQNIIGNDSNETRTKVWAWNGLRELGFNPKSPNILGVILEVPQQGQTEYLAMYADKTARYINYTGSIGVWDTHDTKMDNLIANVIDLSQSKILTEKLSKGRNKSFTEKVRFSFLTTNGIFQTEKAFEELSVNQNEISEVFFAATLVLQQFVDKVINNEER